MHIFADATDMADTAAAIETLLDRLTSERSTPPSFVALHTSARHDISLLRRAISTLGARALHGGTSCLGAMANGRVAVDEGAGLGIFAIWDEDGRYGTGSAEKGNDPKAAGRLAAERALAAAGCIGEAPDLVWLTAVPGGEEAVIAGIEEVAGSSTPIIGGSAADNDLTAQWRSFDSAGEYADGVTVSVLLPSRPVSFAYQNGYAPTRHEGHVTSIDGRRVREIDGRPAAEVYAEWTAGAVAPDTSSGPAAILSESTFFPLGRPVANVADVPFYLLAHPATAHPDGAIELFATVAEGERLLLMTGSAESLTARAGRVAKLAEKKGALEPSGVAGALMVFCGGCMLAVQGKMGEVARDVDEAVGGAPSLGIFTFGEQGPVIDGQNRHGNLMISCVTFSK